jgi:hypothetical protein
MKAVLLVAVLSTVTPHSVVPPHSAVLAHSVVPTHSSVPLQSVVLAHSSVAAYLDQGGTQSASPARDFHLPAGDWDPAALGAMPQPSDLPPAEIYPAPWPRG